VALVPLLPTGRRRGTGSRGGAGRRYRAFISYSHAVDGRLAPALQIGLHRLAKPWCQIPAFAVFRDKTSLAAAPQLWSSIEDAHDGSDLFILLASPAAAGSSWVGKEVA
jgi:hypothetical protein